MTDASRFLPLVFSVRRLQRVLLIWLTALLMVQTVGVLHRVAHAQQSVGVLGHASSVSVKHDGPALAAIWGDHSNSAECQLFDQACPDLLHVSAFRVPIVSSSPVWMALALHERFALFERFYAARGPPAALL